MNIKQTLIRTGSKWELKRKLNTLELNYEILENECKTKDRKIAKLKEENKKLRLEIERKNVK